MQEAVLALLAEDRPDLAWNAHPAQNGLLERLDHFPGADLAEVAALLGRAKGDPALEELLAAGVADAVVGHENDQCVRQLAFLFEACEHTADVQVGHADGVEVIGPVLQ